MPRTVPYGKWDSPLSAGTAAAGAVRFGGLAIDGENIYWTESRPTEGGRQALVRAHPGASATVGGGPAIEDVLPPGWSARSRVHEYGGGAFAVASGTVVFASDRDQRLYRVEPDAGGAPVALVPEGSLRFADLQVDARRGRVLAVCEDHGAGGEPRNSIVAVPLSGGDPEPLVSGADFYAAPRLSPDGAHLAFLEWRHPHMPWDETRLLVAPIDGRGRLGAPEQVAGGPGESILQPAWSPGGVLHFVSDRTGWWNLHRRRDGAEVEPVCPRSAEFAAPPWTLGALTYGWLGERNIVCAFQERGAWRLGLVDGESGRLDEVSCGFTEIAAVAAENRRAVLIAGSPESPLAVHELRLGGSGGAAPEVSRLSSRRSPAREDTGAAGLGGPSNDVSGPALDPSWVSHPEPIEFPTTGGGTARGLYYPPRNPAFVAPAGDRPPLVVTAHGGPTGAASTAQNLALQFWTTRGFAVLDVNYRGSSGYGRAYRDALAGQWGVADVDDCVSGAEHLVRGGLADGARLAIRGGSAGGYTVLAALAFRDIFRAGASYYGVADLEGLARDTHKFESRYLDRLVGPYPEARDVYRARSPLHHAAGISAPVIFFQGLEDKVVPPAQAEAMVAALRGRGLAVEYLPFPDEQHGFRRAENIVRALEAELAFYRRVFKLEGAEEP